MSNALAITRVTGARMNFKGAPATLNGGLS